VRVLLGGHNLAGFSGVVECSGHEKYANESENGVDVFGG